MPSDELCSKLMACFASLSLEQVAVLRNRASRHVQPTVDSVVADKQYVQGQLALLHRRKMETMSLGLATHMDSLRFESADFQ